MRKTQLFTVINIILTIILSAVLLVLYFNQYDIFSRFWYIITIAIINMMLFSKFLIFKSDNLLWFSIVLASLNCYMILSKLAIISLNSWPILVLIPAIASFIVSIFYHGLFHICFMILVSFIAMPMFLLSYNLIVVWVYVIVQIMSILLGILVINMVFNNYRKDIYYG